MAQQPHDPGQRYCMTCGNAVSEGASFCIRCGAPTQRETNTSKKSILKWAGIGCGGLIGLFIFVTIIAAIASSCGNGNMDTASRLSPTPTPVPIRVSAEQIYQDYEGNEVAAKAKYEGKLALITGRIWTVQEAGNYYDVKLQSNAFFSLVSIVCKVDKSEGGKLIPLNPGDSVTVIGVIKGPSVVDIVVENCSLANIPSPRSTGSAAEVPAPMRTETIAPRADPTHIPTAIPTSTPIPNPTAIPAPTPVPIRVSAEQIYQAYEGNEVSAKAKYGGKLALITGTISTVQETDSYYDVKLQTDEFFSLGHIVCKVDKSQKAVVIPLRPSDSVTVLGRVQGVGIIDIVVEDCSISHKLDGE